MGDRIKYLREKSNMTQEELGAIIGVQKSAIRKYEKGEVENIKRSSIKKMADTFGVSPSYLMAWDDEPMPASEEQLNSWDEKYNTNGKLADEVALLEQIKKYYGESAVQLLHLFNSLNENGKHKAIENLEDLNSIPKYQVKEDS